MAAASVHVISDDGAYYENGDVQVFFKDEEGGDDDEDEDVDDEAPPSR